jgi:Xaa-Pro aminopeptidase
VKPTLLPYEKRISVPERERRYSEVRKRMSRESFDLLVISGNSQLDQRGNLRYMTNWLQPVYEEYALFPLKGELIYFSKYPFRAELIRSFCKIKEVRFPKAGQTRPGNILAHGLSEIIKELNPSKIGLVGPSSMSAQFYLDLKDDLPSFHLGNASHILQQTRMIKSDEEIRLVKRSARLGDFALEAFAKAVVPGRKEFEALIDVDAEVKKQGAEDTFYMTSSGRFPVLKFYNMAYRIYRKGDLVLFNIEPAGQGGYFTQMVRTLSIGKPNPRIAEAYHCCLEALQKAVQAMRPGVKASDIFQSMKKTVEDRSLGLDRNTGHSQGLDVLEPPLVSESDHTELEPGMIIVLHPKVSISPQAQVWVGNTYLITAKGATCLNKADNQLMIL